MAAVVERVTAGLQILEEVVRRAAEAQAPRRRRGNRRRSL